MRAHLVTVPQTGEDPSRSVYCATNAEATAMRAALWEPLRDAIKKSDVSIEQVDVPTDKPGLIAYLNELIG